MNKRAWSGQDYVASVILFSAVIALVYLMIGSLSVDYNNPNIVDGSFVQHYNKLENNTKMVDGMLEATSGEDGLNLLDLGEILLTSTLSVANILFGSLKTIAVQIGSFGTDFGIPTEVTSIALVTLLALITSGLIFLLINAINKTHRL